MSRALSPQLRLLTRPAADSADASESENMRAARDGAATDKAATNQYPPTTAPGDALAALAALAAAFAAALCVSAVVTLFGGAGGDIFEGFVAVFAVVGIAVGLWLAVLCPRPSMLVDARDARRALSQRAGHAHLPPLPPMIPPHGPGAPSLWPSAAEADADDRRACLCAADAVVDAGAAALAALGRAHAGVRAAAALELGLVSAHAAPELSALPVERRENAHAARGGSSQRGLYANRRRGRIRDAFGACAAALHRGGDGCRETSFAALRDGLARDVVRVAAEALDAAYASDVCAARAATMRAVAAAVGLDDAVVWLSAALEKDDSPDCALRGVVDNCDLAAAALRLAAAGRGDGWVEKAAAHLAVATEALQIDRAALRPAAQSDGAAHHAAAAEPLAAQPARCFGDEDEGDDDGDDDGGCTPEPEAPPGTVRRGATVVYAGAGAAPAERPLRRNDGAAPAPHGRGQLVSLLSELKAALAAHAADDAPPDAPPADDAPPDAPPADAPTAEGAPIVARGLCSEDPRFASVFKILEAQLAARNRSAAAS
ncbi:hypothetical protein M885DRAFT_613123 [Pelagophyceae sp. CCMP2097]|nr:hypothetical protein M885DRAFT_613123 [Pelagophyceae sp. CCMP2097]